MLLISSRILIMCVSDSRSLKIGNWCGTPALSMQASVSVTMMAPEPEAKLARKDAN